jgi:pimeloyl-ACP methyl ester carboxylesterase
MTARDDVDWTFGGTWPYEPKWLETDDVRIHYVDEGARDGEPVAMLHGNPTWSYLYRRFIRGLVDAGFRAIAHDETGFGRSDKPASEYEYSIQRHVRHFAALMDELGVERVTLVLQDWGGPIGLGWAVDHPERVSRLVILNTWPGGRELPDHPAPTGFFRLVRARGPGDLLVRRLNLFTRMILFRGGVVHRDRLGDVEKAAYLAPHPTAASRAGVMAFPRLIPWEDDNPTRPLGEHIERGLMRLTDKPVLICWPGKDPAFKQKTLAMWRRIFPHAEVHEFDDAGHYIQEDAHERIVPLLVDFLKRTAPAAAPAEEGVAEGAAADEEPAKKKPSAKRPTAARKTAAKAKPATEKKRSSKRTTRKKPEE